MSTSLLLAIASTFGAATGVFLAPSLVAHANWLAAILLLLGFVTAARGMLAKIPDDDFGTITVPAPVPRLSKTPGHIFKSGGRVGESTREVLRELAGLDDADIARLESAAVIKCASAADHA